MARTPRLLACAQPYLKTIMMPASPARARGEELANACTAKAERAGFDAEGVRRFVLGYLARHGKASGEAIVDACKAVGLRPGEDRAFGSIFATLSRKGLIRCAGYCERQKGHGTAGGRLWELNAP